MECQLHQLAVGPPAVNMEMVGSLGHPSFTHTHPARTLPRAPYPSLCTDKRRGMKGGREGEVGNGGIAELADYTPCLLRLVGWDQTGRGSPMRLSSGVCVCK